MKERITLDGIWRGAFGKDCASPVCFADTEGMTEITSTVPGALETDLEKNGYLPELFFGENILLAQQHESDHFCLSRSFTYQKKAGFTDTLVFEGIDCFADLFIDGEKIGENSNMLIEKRISLDFLEDGGHELFVHIRPAVIEARKTPLPPYVNAMKYNFDSLYVRKAPHQYGWDIMPRAVSAGIWKHVYIERLPDTHIDDIFLSTVWANTGEAKIKITLNCAVPAGSVQDYTVSLKGKCGDSEFSFTEKLWHTGAVKYMNIREPKLWNVKNYGDANVYEVTAELLRGDEVLDTYRTSFGIRTAALTRTSTTDADGNGDFCFVINGGRVFAMGTNWVPVDAFHWRDEERLGDILPMLTDLGCNIVRCWGGNVYENDAFYDFCDRNGIMVWQDFSMACAVYPQDEFFCDQLREEAESVVKRLRNHPSLVLWAGDNECDCAYSWTGEKRDPNDNVLTRKILPDVIRQHDGSRPYLPSSPYMDEEAFRSGKPTSEDHLWGPRDYFKGNYYKNTVCHFASETGYHGCPSPESLKKYIGEDHLWPCLGDRHWLVHAATMEGREDAPYGYRIGLMYRQVETLFGKDSEATADLDSFSLASQISQAEAKKYFIERFRITKGRRNGIIWWNLIDGWPQISDAIVDYYLDKKLAYSYIKRSQTPLCLMFDEPKDGLLTLYAVNDTQQPKHIAYLVEDDEGNIVLSGETTVKADCSSPVASLDASDEKRYYIIRWGSEDGVGVNHYFANIIDIDFDYYKTLLGKLEG